MPGKRARSGRPGILGKWSDRCYLSGAREHGDDQHQDHRAAANGTLIACRAVPSLLCYQSPSTTLDFRPSKYVDVTATMDGKLDLIRSFATQTDKCAYLESDLVVSTARYWGRYAGYKLVEPLEVVRSVE